MSRRAVELRSIYIFRRPGFSMQHGANRCGKPMRPLHGPPLTIRNFSLYAAQHRDTELPAHFSVVQAEKVPTWMIVRLYLLSDKVTRCPHAELSFCTPECTQVFHTVASLCAMQPELLRTGGGNDEPPRPAVHVHHPAISSIAHNGH